jgi:hypothetical protein
MFEHVAVTVTPGCGVGVGLAVGIGVGAGVALGVGAAVGVGVASRAVGATGLDPQAARLKAAIAEPQMLVSFMSASAHSTSTVINSYICAKASNVSFDVRLRRSDEVRVDLRPEPWTAARGFHVAEGRSPTARPA